jgi:PDZ domain-containing secreted protein
MIAIDDKAILTYDEMNEIKNSHKVGDTITIKFVRNGSTQTTQLTLVEE